MIRVLLFLGLLFGLALAFAKLADIPGMVTVSFGDYDLQGTPVVVALAVGIFLVAFLALVWVLRVILNTRSITSRFFKRRRKEKGFAALSQGLIALGTGNAKAARRHGLDAERLLAEEPAAKLLLAQTAQLAGKDEEARQRFEAMLENPETKALGLHGLFVEAERHKEPVAARHYAEEAAKVAPGLEWAGKAVLGYQAVSHHWEEALKTLERNYAAKLLDKKSYRRQRAVILTALAKGLEVAEPERAFAFAKEAHGLALDLVPAAVLTSRLATRRGDIRKAAKVLEATWRLFPHPELAETYAHVRTGDSAVDRLKRVKSLSAQRANTPEGAVAIARAAIEAREFEEARLQLKKVLQSTPTRSAFVLMAEVEEAEHGDRGRMRDWLSRAVKAPLDKAWIADGVVLAEWQAVSPVTGKLDAFVWSTPVGLDAGAGEVLEDSLFDALVLPPAAPEPADMPEPVQSVSDTPKTLEIEPEKPADAADKALAPVAAAGSAGTDGPEASPGLVETGYEGTTDDVRYAPSLKNLPDAPASEKSSADVKKAPDVIEPAEDAAGKGAAEPEAEAEKGNGQSDPAQNAEAKDAAQKPAGTENGKPDANGPSDRKAEDADDMSRPIEFPLSRMPDDPGTEEEAERKLAKAPRPRFFN